MSFPSTLSTFNRPSPNDRLNSPSHSALHNTVSSALGQVEAVIGVEGAASVVGTLQYLIKSPVSNGGGHVQTAVTGGTGQTSFTKGDILVAQSTLVLTKLSVGNQRNVLMVDNSSSSGIKWGGPVKLGQNASVLSLIGTTSETSIMSVSVPSSVLSTSNTIRATLFVSAYTIGNSSDSLTLKANYGTNTVGTIVLSPSATSTSSVKGKIEYFLSANASQSLQRAQVLVDWGVDRLNIAQSSVLGINAFRSGTSSINSANTQQIGVTATWSSANAGTRLDIDGYVVELIS